MKKLLGILAVLGFSVTTTASVVACGCKLKEENQKVVDKILKVDNAESRITLGTSANSLVQKYNGEFIANFLDSETKQIFEVDDFKTLNVTKENGEAIHDSDLLKPEATLKAKLNFDYGFVKNQNVDLKITVDTEDDLITKGISEANYQLSLQWDEPWSPSDIQEKIDTNTTFIKEKLSPLAQELFKDIKYKTNSVSLITENFETAEEVKATINFNYGDNKDQVTNLTIQRIYQTIEANLDDAEILVEKDTKLTITNYNLLRGVKIQDDGKVKVEDHQDGTATITGEQTGEVKIKITAANAKDTKELTLTISPWLTIDATIGKQKIEVNQTTTIRVANYQQLDNLEATARPADKVELDRSAINQGKITVKGKAIGNVTITLSANNAKPFKDFSLEITKQTYDIDASIDKQKIEVNQTATITVKNYQQLDNLQATASPNGNVNLSAINQGKITVTGQAVGDVTITLTADNMKTPKNLSLKITKQTYDIEATIDKQKIEVNQTATITVANYQQLDNLQASANPKDSVEFNYDAINQGKITVTGKEMGDVTITLTANNMKAPKDFSLAITQQTFDIVATIDEQKIEVNGTATITVANYQQLDNLQASANPKDSVEFNYDAINQGKITVTGKEMGDVTITLTANNMKAPKDFSLAITQQTFDIVATIDEQKIEVNGTATITVANHQQLKKLQASANLKDNVEFNYDAINQGKIIVKALKEGNVTITLTADNMKAPKDFSLAITQQTFEIDATIGPSSIEVGQTATITITNYQQLKKLQASANLKNNVEFDYSAIDQGKITAKALKEGNVTITLTADNMKTTKELHLNITQQTFEIDATIGPSSIEVGQTATITITNYQQLKKLQASANLKNNVEFDYSAIDQGKITAKALKEGNVTITLTADNMKTTKELHLNITQQTFEIDATIGPSSIEVGQTATITITNYQQLKKLQASANLKNNVEFDYSAIDQGKITAKALKEGNVTITLTADNMKTTKELHLNITQQTFEIDATIGPSSIEVGQTATITVANYQQLKNLQASANLKDSVEFNYDTINQGKITAKALKEGNVTITLTADNMKAAKELHLNIAQQTFDIVASIDPTSITIDEVATITVANYQQLKHLWAEADHPDFVDLSAINEGKITVTPKIIGVGNNVSITISADNAKKPITLTLNIISDPAYDISAILTNKNINGNNDEQPPKSKTEEETIVATLAANPLSEERGLKKEHLEIKKFEPATKTSEGSALIVAKSDSKFTGEVNIVLSRLGTNEEQEVIDVLNNNAGLAPGKQFKQKIPLEDLIAWFQDKKNKFYHDFLKAITDGKFTEDKFSVTNKFNVLDDETKIERPLTQEDINRNSTGKGKLRISFYYNYGGFLKQKMWTILDFENSK